MNQAIDKATQQFAEMSGLNWDSLTEVEQHELAGQVASAIGVYNKWTHGQSYEQAQKDLLEARRLLASRVDASRLEEANRRIAELEAELESRPFETTGDQLTDDLLVWLDGSGPNEAGWCDANDMSKDSLYCFVAKRKPAPPKTVAQIINEHRELDSPRSNEAIAQGPCSCGTAQFGIPHSEHIESVLREAGKLVEG